jgi:cell division protein FtsX
VVFLFSFLHCAVVFFITLTLFCGVFVFIWKTQHNLGIKTKTPHNKVGIMKNTTKQCRNENKNTTKQWFSLFLHCCVVFSF